MHRVFLDQKNMGSLFNRAERTCFSFLFFFGFSCSKVKPHIYTYTYIYTHTYKYTYVYSLMRIVEKGVGC